VSDIAWAAWLLVALVLLGAEALTLQFVLRYFGLGALVAAAVSPFASGVAQGLVFAASAVLLMVLTRRPVLAYVAAIHTGNPTPDLLALKYIEALPQLAQGQASSLFLIPSDVAQALGGLATMGAAFRQCGDVSAGGAPPPTT
jgi:hypothetical protein